VLAEAAAAAFCAPVFTSLVLAVAAAAAFSALAFTSLVLAFFFDAALWLRHTVFAPAPPSMVLAEAAAATFSVLVFTSLVLAFSVSVDAALCLRHTFGTLALGGGWARLVRATILVYCASRLQDIIKHEEQIDLDPFDMCRIIPLLPTS